MASKAIKAAAKATHVALTPEQLEASYWNMAARALANGLLRSLDQAAKARAKVLDVAAEADSGFVLKSIVDATLEAASRGAAAGAYREALEYARARGCAEAVREVLFALEELGDVRHPLTPDSAAKVAEAFAAIGYDPAA
jgi:hypothetical protein